MARTFLLSAAINSVLFLTGLIAGEMLPNSPLSRLAAASVMTALGLHLAVFFYLKVTTHRATTIVSSRGLPDRFLAQASKNERRPFWFICVSVILILELLITAPTDSSYSPIQSHVHLALAGFAVAFNLGTFLVEYTSIAAQSWLLDDVRNGDTRSRASVTT